MQRSTFARVAASRVSLHWTPPLTLMSHGAEFQCKHRSAASVPTQSHNCLARNDSELSVRSSLAFVGSLQLVLFCVKRSFFSLPDSLSLYQRQCPLLTSHLPDCFILSDCRTWSMCVKTQKSHLCLWKKGVM